MTASSGLRGAGTLEPGRKIRVARAARLVGLPGVEPFTGADPDVLDGELGGQGVRAGRAELLLVVCGEDPGPTAGGCTADAVVSAYLTATGP